MTVIGIDVNMADGYEFDVFLSHNSKNKPVVKRLANELKKRGLKVWLDEWELIPGRPWQEAIEQIIQTTKTAAVLVGKDGMGPWEIPEMRACLSEFVDRNLPVIPVLLPEAPKKPKLPLFLKLFTWVDLRKGLTKKELDRLELGIRAKRPPEDVAVEQDNINNIPFNSLGNLFKGRSEDFDKLKDQLSDKSQTTAITQKQKAKPGAIYGLGGIGKTRLAVEFGWYALEQLGYNAVLFVNCGQELYDKDQPSEPHQELKSDKSAVERLYAEMAKLASADLLDIKGSDAMLPEAACHEVIKELQSRQDWLIVFDNVDSNDICNAVKATLPKLRAGKVIITSRLANWTGDIKPLELKKLSLDASIEYLLQKTADKRHSADNDREKVKELAQKLDGLPVALEQAAAYIIYEKITFQQYLIDLHEVKLEVLGFEAKNLNLADYPEPVLRTWAVTEQKLSTHAKAVLTISAFLSADNIPEALLLNQSKIVLAVSSVLEEASEEELKSIVNSDGDLRAVRRSIAQLNSYSMISRNTSDKTFSIHRLVQEVARVRLSDSYKELFTQLILKMIDNDCPDHQTAIKSNFSWHKAMANHISAITAFTKRMWPVISEILKEVADPLAAQINNLAEFYRTQARFYEAETLLLRAAKIYDKLVGENHTNVATVLNNLSLVYHATNRLAEAEPLAKRALAIDEACLGKDHPIVAKRLNNLAMLYQSTNRLAEAEPLMKRAMAIDEASFSKDHPSVAIHLNNLAQLYKNTNRLTEAEPLMERALKIDETALGKDHPEVARDLNNLAMLYESTNRLAEAEPLMQRALKIGEASLGKDHPNVATALNNLALLYKATNRLKEAETLMERALKIDEAAFGSEHPNIATRLNNLALLYKGTNRLKEAEPLMKRALKIDEASFGKDHPDVAIDLSNLALLYHTTNHLKEAEPLMKRVVEILLQFTRRTGHPHPHLEDAMNNYGGLLMQMGHSEDQVAVRLKRLAPEMVKQPGGQPEEE